MAAKVYYSPFIPAFSSNGAPVPGAKIYFFYTETNDPAPIYSDVGLNTPLTNPVEADLAGRFPNIYLDGDITYRVRYTDADDVPLSNDIDPYIPGQAFIGGLTPLAGFVWADDYGGSISAAIDALPPAGGTVLLSATEYISPYQNSNLPSTIPTDVMTKDNITIKGVARPNYNSTFSALTGGSIIRGSFFFGANNVTIIDCGIDSGEEFCDEFYSGVPQEGLIAYDAEQLGGPVIQSWRNAVIDNVSILCHKTGKTGDTSDVHALLLENYNGWTINNVQTVKGGAGIVIKSNHGSLNNVYCRGHFKYSVLNKSEGYSSASFNTYSNIVCQNLLNTSPDISVASQFDTSGFIIQASSAAATGIVANGIVCNGVINAVFIQGLSGFACTDIAVSNVTAQNIYDAVVLTSNNCYRVHVDTVIGNVSNRGIVFGTGSTWCSATDCEVQGSTGYAYENSGLYTRLRVCGSDSPAAGHIRIIAGLVTVRGGFDAVGTGTLLTTLGGAIIGLYEPSAGYEDKATSVVVYTPTTSDRLGINRSDPVAPLDVASPVNTTAMSVGPITGSMTTGQTVGFTIRLRNSAGGAVAGDGKSEGAGIYAYMPGSGVNAGGMKFFTRKDSSTFTEGARIDERDNLVVGTMAAATTSSKTLHLSEAIVPTANPTGGGVLYVESGALKYRGTSGTVTTVAPA